MLIKGLLKLVTGIFLKERSSTPPTPSAGEKLLYAKDDGKVYTLDSTGKESSIGSGLVLVSLDHTDDAGSGYNTTEQEHYLCDTSGGTFTVNLPAGDEGFKIRFSDAGNAWATNNLTISPAAGETIDGYAADEDLVLDVNRSWVQLNWDNDNSVWLVDTLATQDVIQQSDASVTDNTLPRYDGTTGQLIQGSGIVVADTTNNVSGMGTLSCGAITSTGSSTFGDTAGGTAQRMYGKDASGNIDLPSVITSSASGAGGTSLYTIIDHTNSWCGFRATGNTGAAKELRFYAGTSNVGGHSSTGAWTLGLASNRAVINQTTNTTAINSNAYYSGFSEYRSDTTRAGACLIVNAPASDGGNVYEFCVNKDGEATNAPHTVIGSATPLGAWTLGPSSDANTLTHPVYGRIASRTSTTGNYFYCKTSTTTDAILRMFSDVSGTEVLKFRVEADGDVISATNSYTSDERAKKLIRAIPYGLNEIMQLNPSGFRWNHEDDDAIESFSVATAQNLEQVMPEMVRDDGLEYIDENGETKQYKAIYDKEVMAVMVKAIQELNAKHEAVVAELRAEIELLKNPLQQ